jgi:hypothetical protein
MTYDKLGRLLTREIVAAGAPDPVLTSNTYDEPANIVCLPSHSGVNSIASDHCGCQNGVYTRERERELTEIWDALKSGDINRGEARKRLRESMDRLRAQHLDVTMMLNRASERARDERAARNGSSGGSGGGSPRAEAAIRNGQEGLY